ncbi:MAG: hypothetical protein Q7S67_03125, partial [Telluria sp.]|nr:hypothetical protein [Telluria sp.]
VIIPPTTFGRVLKAIAGGDPMASLKDDGVASFLAKKCTNDFLRLYFEDPALIEMLPSRISTPYRFDSALTLLIRLNGAGALPNEVRLAAAERILGLAETMYWRGFVDGSLVGELFSEEENAQLLLRQKDVVYSNQDEIINDVEGSWNESDDVDDALHDIKNLVERFIEENDFLYGEEGYVEAEPKKGAKFLEAIEDRARLMRQRQPEAATYKALETENAITTDLISARSIFDDIDD